MRIPQESLEAKRMIGVVPEDLALFDNLTAREYLTFIGRMYLLEQQTIRTRIDELLSLLGLQNDEKKLTIEYSHGMKKKLALAAALLPNPQLLFLDEPFEGVDAVTSRVIRDMLATYVERGSTVFLTSQVACRDHRERETGRTDIARSAPARQFAGTALPRAGGRRRRSHEKTVVARRIAR
jgi:ABC-2 type transport system ATP-binding protein